MMAFPSATSLRRHIVGTCDMSETVGFTGAPLYAKGTVVIHVSALRFLYVRVLKRREMKEDLPYPKCRKRLPVVLSREEVGTSSIQPKISFTAPC